MAIRRRYGGLVIFLIINHRIERSLWRQARQQSFIFSSPYFFNSIRYQILNVTLKRLRSVVVVNLHTLFCAKTLAPNKFNSVRPACYPARVTVLYISGRSVSVGWQWVVFTATTAMFWLAVSSAALRWESSSRSNVTTTRPARSAARRVPASVNATTTVSNNRVHVTACNRRLIV